MNDFPTEVSTEVPVKSIISFRDTRWQMRWIVLGLLFLLLSRCISFVDQEWLANIPSWLYLIITGVILQAFLIFLPIVTRSSDRRAFFGVPKFTRWLIEFAIAVPVVIGTFFVLGVVNYFVERLAPGTSLSPEVIKNLPRSPNPILVVSWLVLSFTIGPVAEEIFFRGFLHNAFRVRMPVVSAGLVQSLIFAVCHVYSPLQIGVVFVLGLVLTGVYEWRKTLVTPILVHIGINLISAMMVLTLMWLHANRPIMGVICEPSAAECVIREIVPNSAAEEAGLEVGDRITTFNGQPVRNFDQLLELIRLYRPGDAIPLKIKRAGMEVEVTVVLRRRGDS